MNNEESVILLGEAKMSKTLIKMGVPTMVGMMVSALYNVVDAYWVGRLGALATAAVSVVYPLSAIGMMVGLLFGCGTNSVIARLLGQHREQEVKEYCSTALYTALGTIIILISLMLLGLQPILSALGTTDNCREVASEYAVIFTLGLFFNVLNMCMNNMIVAEGNSFMSMLAMALGGVTNLILDPILIIILGMGVKGAAIATLISRVVSTVIYLQHVIRGRSKLSIDPRLICFDAKHLGEIIRIGLPIAVFQLIAGLSGGIVNLLAKPYGENPQAAIGIVNRVMFLEMNLLYGFFKGYSPVVGYNFGAGKMDRVKEATKLGLIWSTTITMLIGAIMIGFREQILWMFNKDSLEVNSIGAFALAVYAISYTTYGYQIIIGNFFLAIGEAKRGGLLSLGKGLLYIVFLLILEHFAGLLGIIFAQLAADIVGTTITALTYAQFDSVTKKDLSLSNIQYGAEAMSGNRKRKM